MQTFLLFFLCLTVSMGQAFAQQDSTKQLPKEITDFIDNEVQNEGLSLSCQDLRTWQKDRKMKMAILDTREHKVFLDLHIKGARRMGSNDDFTLANIWHQRRNRPIVVYSEDGIEGKKSAAKLRDMGFEMVYNLKGGFKEWNRLLYPVSGIKKKAKFRKK